MRCERHTEASSPRSQSSCPAFSSRCGRLPHATFLDATVQVYKLKVRAVAEGDVFLMQPYQATLAVPVKRRRRKKSGDGEGGREDSSSASETEASIDCSEDSLLPPSDSDGRCSLCSTADSDLEEKGGSDSDDALAQPPPAEVEEDMESEVIGADEAVTRSALTTHPTKL